MAVKDISDQEIFEAIRKSKNSNEPWPYDFLPQHPVKVVMRKMEQMHRRGIIGAGVSLRSAWIVGEENQ